MTALDFCPLLGSSTRHGRSRTHKDFPSSHGPSFCKIFISSCPWCYQDVWYIQIWTWYGI